MESVDTTAGDELPCDTVTYRPYVSEVHMQNATLTVEETAKFLGIGRNSAYEGIRTGEIPSVRIGKRILVPRAALERLLQVADLPAEAEPEAA